MTEYSLRAVVRVRYKTDDKHEVAGWLKAILVDAGYEVDVCEVREVRRLEESRE